MNILGRSCGGVLGKAPGEVREDALARTPEGGPKVGEDPRGWAQGIRETGPQRV